MSSVESKDSFYVYVLFLIWPLLAVASAFKNYKMPWAKNIFWIFCIFYGYTFVIEIGTGRDVARYVAEFQRLYGVNVSIIEYMEQTEKADYLKNFIAIALSRFTDSAPMLTMVYAIIFGFFFSRNIWYILERLEGRMLPVTILLLTCYLLVNPIWNINGFRMNTAVHIFLYGLLPYLCEGKKNGIWISMCSLLVHFAFLVPISVLLVYILAGNRLTFYYGFFIATFFLAEIDIATFNFYVETYTPEIIQDRTSGYRGEQTVENFRESESMSNWYAVWYKPALNWVLMGFLSILFFKGREFFKSNRQWLNLFCFVLLFYGVANLFTSIPSGSRFLDIAHLCALTLIIFFLQNRPEESFMKWYILGASPAILLFIMVAIRIGLHSTGVTSILGNPLIALLTAGNDFSLNELMRMIL